MGLASNITIFDDYKVLLLKTLDVDDSSSIFNPLIDGAIFQVSMQKLAGGMGIEWNYGQLKW